MRWNRFPWCSIGRIVAVAAVCLIVSVVGQAQEPRIPPLESASGINISKTLANHPDLFHIQGLQSIL